MAKWRVHPSSGINFRSLVKPLLIATVVLGMVACGTNQVPATPTPRPIASPVSAPAQPVQTPTATQAAGRDMEAYFRGKTITMLVGFAPGGGYDTFARMASRVLPQHLPGNPRVVVRNLAGAGGQRGLQAAQRAAPDGLTAHIVHPRWIRRDLLGIEVPEFSISNTTWLAVLGGTPTTNAHYARKTLVNSWADVQALGRAVTTGATEPGSSGNMGAAYIELIGGPVRTVYGYGGTAEIAAAFDRGELDITYVANPEIAPRLYPEWAAQQLVAPLFYWSTPPAEDPQFMDWMRQLGTQPPPHVHDVINSEDWQQRTFDIAVAVGDLTSRTFHLPPGVPNDITAAWREAMRGVAQDPLFAELGAAAGYAVGYTDPEALERELLAIQRDLTDPRVSALFLELSGGED